MAPRPGVYHIEAGAGPSATDVMVECTNKREALTTAASAVRQRGPNSWATVWAGTDFLHAPIARWRCGRRVVISPASHP
jgi:hypothetical protein